MNLLMYKAISLSRELDLKSYKGKNIYHNTKLLLQLYSKVLWRIEHSLKEMNTECFYLNKNSLAEAIESLMDMNTDLDRLNLENRLESLDVSKVILELINKALVLLGAYPEKGERYFDLLNKMYVINYRYSENEMLEYLNIGRTTFYKEKKDAIHMLGVILWGFVIPDMKGKQGEELKVAEEYDSYRTQA
jgi:hypothetical protein